MHRIPAVCWWHQHFLTVAWPQWVCNCTAGPERGCDGSEQGPAVTWWTSSLPYDFRRQFSRPSGGSQLASRADVMSWFSSSKEVMDHVHATWDFVGWNWLPWQHCSFGMVPVCKHCKALTIRYFQKWTKVTKKALMLKSFTGLRKCNVHRLPLLLLPPCTVPHYRTCWKTKNSGALCPLGNRQLPAPAEKQQVLVPQILRSPMCLLSNATPGDTGPDPPPCHHPSAHRPQGKGAVPAAPEGAVAA